MEKEFWHQAWAENRIGFHMSEVNPTLIKFCEKITQCEKRKVLLPLCGKTLDLIWFSEKVEKVYGVELSESAILQFFEENELEYKTREEGPFKIFTSKNIEIYCGDFFEFPIEKLGVELVFDRGALVALPLEMRMNYLQKMKNELPKGSKWLLDVFDYDQNKMDGPPFSVSEDEIRSQLGDEFKIELIDDKPFPLFEIDNFFLKTYFLEN